MTQTQLNNWLYYLQCKYSTWATKFNASLSYGTCIDSFIENNITISNLFGPLHRYIPFTSTVTNAFSISLSQLIADTNVTITFTLNGFPISYTGPNDLDSILTSITSQINTNTTTHTYEAVYVEGTIYIYTYTVGDVFAIPTITLTENTVGLTGPSVTISSVSLENNLEVILNTWNCLTLEQICTVKIKLNSLLGNCNC